MGEWILSNIKSSLLLYQHEDAPYSYFTFLNIAIRPCYWGHPGNAVRETKLKQKVDSCLQFAEVYIMKMLRPAASVVLHIKQSTYLPKRLSARYSHREPLGVDNGHDNTPIWRNTLQDSGTLNIIYILQAASHVLRNAMGVGGVKFPRKVLRRCTVQHY